MPRKQHVVRLSREDRRTLTHRSTWSLQRARILLATDAAATDAAVAAAVMVDPRTVARVRVQFATTDLDTTLGRRPRRTAPPGKLDGAADARLVALTCSAPPAGQARGTLRVLADRAVALEIIDTVSHETVRQTLNKGGSSRGAPSGS